MSGFSLTHSLPAAVCLFVTGIATARAGVLVEEGTPEPAAQLSTYGMQVSVERAIHGVLPHAWRAVLQPGIALPGKVSWDPHDTWITVLRRISSHSDAGFLIDWNTREIYVRSVSTTLEDAGERERTRRAATTPLPQFTVAPKANSTIAPPTEPVLENVPPVVSLKVTSETESPAQVPLDSTPPQLHPEPLPVAVADSLPAIEVSEPEGQTDFEPRSFSGVSVREPLVALARRHGVTLHFDIADFTLPGALTLMFTEDLAADMELLERALGPKFPLEIAHFREEKELRVRAGAQASFRSLAKRPQAPVARRSLLSRLLVHTFDAGGKAFEARRESVK